MVFSPGSIKDEKRVGFGAFASPDDPATGPFDEVSEPSEASGQRVVVGKQQVLLALARYRGPSGDGRLDALRLRYAMTATGMSEYEQRVVLGGEFSSARADLAVCADNITEYAKYEHDRCVDFLERLDHADLSYLAQPSAFLTVLYGIAVADHRRNGADSAMKRAWDMIHLVLIMYFFIASTYVNVLFFTWDDSDDLPNGERLRNSFYGVTVFWVLDLFLTTQLATTDDSGHVLMQPSDIMRRKAWVIGIDLVSVLPLDFIFGAQRIWWAFAVFRYAKYIKVARTAFLFEVVNRSIVTKGRLRFYYELKPVFNGIFWTCIVTHCGAILHSFADQQNDDGHRNFPLFIDSFITMQAGLFGSTANIVTFTYQDQTLMVLFMLVTLVMEGVVTAKASALLLSRDVEGENQRRLRATLSMVGHYKVPRSIQREVLSYQLHDLNDNATHHMQDLAVLPDAMLSDVKTYSKISAVRQVPLFADASRACQELLAQMLTRNEFPPERAMVSFGEIGDEMFMITHGYAEVVLGNGMIVADLSRGNFFGEVALFSADGKRMATVRALTYVDAWRLGRRQFLVVCARFQEFYDRILQEVQARNADVDAFAAAVDEARTFKNLAATTESEAGVSTTDIHDRSAQFGSGAERQRNPLANIRAGHAHRRSTMGATPRGAVDGALPGGGSPNTRPLESHDSRVSRRSQLQSSAPSSTNLRAVRRRQSLAAKLDQKDHAKLEQSTMAPSGGRFLNAGRSVYGRRMSRQFLVPGADLHGARHDADVDPADLQRIEARLSNLEATIRSTAEDAAAALRLLQTDADEHDQK